MDKKLFEHTVAGLEALLGTDPELEELHNNLFNQDYFVSYHSEAEQWLSEQGSVFEAIARVVDYETGSYGEIHTDVSNPSEVANMLAYIMGEELLNDIDYRPTKMGGNVKYLSDRHIHELLHKVYEHAGEEYRLDSKDITKLLNDSDGLGLSAVAESKDLIIVFEPSFGFGAESLEDFEKAEKELKEMSQYGEGWSMGVSYDASGYKYWMKRQQEMVHVYLSLILDSANAVTFEEFEDIESAIEEMLSELEDFAERYNYDPSK
jgi:hypothetical protein